MSGKLVLYEIPGRNKYESANTETKQVEICVNCNRLQDLVSLYFSTKYQSAGSEAEMLSYMQTKLLADSLNFTTVQIQTALDTCKNSWKKNVGFHAELGGYVNMNQSPQVHFRTDNFSLEAWVFPEAINNTIQHIVANHTIRPISGVENMGGYRLYMLSGKLYLQMGDYSGALASGGCAQIRTITTISASEWHHIIAVRNGNNAANFKIYVDGVLQQTEVADYSYLNNGNVYNESNSGRLVYGNRSGSGVGESFIGFIKNVKIYKKVMTATEALANYTSCSGAPADTTNLVLWTRLENGSGTVVSDSSRFATNGIMTASAGWGGGVGIAANANCIGEKEGVLCVTRTVTVPVVKGYRYGFNGKENDNEPKGIEGSQQDYGMRIYDPRAGRFLSVDPLIKSYPMITPYQFAENSPISGIDLDGEEFLYYLINMVQQNGTVVLLQPTFQRVENTVQHKVELITGNTVTINFPRSQAWVANVGFYNYKFASYQAMQNAVNVLKDPEIEKQSRECHCLPGIDLAYTVEAEERVGNFLQGIGNAAAAGVAVGDAAKNFKVLAKQFSHLKRLGRTTEESVRKKLNDYVLNAEHAGDGKTKAKWFKEALGFTQENAADLAKQIVFDESKAVKTVMTEHGQKYNQLFSVTGANGKTIDDVVFGFIKNEDGVVRMTTAIPKKK